MLMPNKPRKRSKTTQIPDDLLHRLNEFTSSGFIIFSLDAKNNLSVNSSMDSQEAFFCLSKYIECWLKSLDQTLVDQMSKSIKRNKNS